MPSFCFRYMQKIASAAIAALLAFCIVSVTQSPVRAADKKPELLGTMEFKGKITRLPQWSAVLKRMRMWKGYFKGSETRGLPSRKGWLELKRGISSKTPVEQLKAVNRYFNQWPYRLDKSNYGQSDYWASPFEFLKKSGDCEDYSIAKYYALKELGFTISNLRIVALKDTIRNVGHAVLAVYIKDEIYILDNQTVIVLPHDRYSHYVPQYSVNEKFRWMHVPVPGKGSGFKP